MKSDPTDEKLAELLERAAPPLCQEARERALGQMAKGAVARARPRRRRWAVLAGAFAALLIGLGFLSLPTGSAKGAWAQALSLASRATMVHVTGHKWTEEGEVEFERWESRGGFLREEERQDGRLVQLRLNTEGRLLFYNAYLRETLSSDMPPRPEILPASLPEQEHVARWVESVRRFEAFSHLKVAERREGNLCGGLRDVVEVEGLLRGRLFDNGTMYKSGDRYRWRVEIDPSSGRMVSEERYRRVKGGPWELVLQTDSIEWGGEIPEKAREFTSPAGTRITSVRWWKGRADRVLAEGATPDWEVRLHSIDVNRKGDLYLMLSRRRTPHSRVPETYNSTTMPIVVEEAPDGAGGWYIQRDDFSCAYEYWVTVLKHESAPENPSPPDRVALNIYPFPDPMSDINEFVTFKDLPLPPRQQGEDLLREAIAQGLH